MFIHREDYQKSASDRDNTSMVEAEILVEKHRNGPTGYVKLHFDKEKTSFLNIDKHFGEFANVPEANISVIEDF